MRGVADTTSRYTTGERGYQIPQAITPQVRGVADTANRYTTGEGAADTASRYTTENDGTKIGRLWARRSGAKKKPDSAVLGALFDLVRWCVATSRAPQNERSLTLTAHVLQGQILRGAGRPLTPSQQNQELGTPTGNGQPPPTILQTPGELGGPLGDLSPPTVRGELGGPLGDPYPTHSPW